MKTSKFVGSAHASTVEQMKHILSDLSWDDPSVVYVMNEDGERLTLRLRENMLSDNSITYDIVVS